MPWIAACASAQPPSRGQWPTFRHDRRLTGRALGKGNLTTPAVAWEIDLRGYRWWVDIAGGPADTELALHARDAIGPLTQAARIAWGIASPPVDLAGDGRRVPAPPLTRKMMADLPGLQTVVTHMIDHERGYCELEAHDHPGRRPLWRSEIFRVFQRPHPVLVDANADGQLDVVVCPHYQVAVLDGRTGRTVERLRWHDGRNYGHFIVKNIDDDPALEMCVIADFFSHMEMIDNDGKKLKLLWRKEIELKIENKAKIVRPRGDSLQDLDGDGRFEMVLSLYNETGDARWHLMVYDALTGEVRLDQPDQLLEGLRDIDNDGQMELFCSRAGTLFVPASSALTVFSYRNGKLEPRWSRGAGHWVTAAEGYPPYMNSSVANGDQNVVLAGGNGEQTHHFFVAGPRSAAAGPTLTAYRVSRDGHVRPAWTCRTDAGVKRLGIAGHRSAAGTADRVLLTLTTAGRDSRLVFEHASGHRAAVTRAPCESPGRSAGGELIAARLGSDHRVSIVTTAGNRDVVALIAGKDQPRIAWRRRGGMAVVAADLDGDRRREVAVLDQQPSGEGRVVVYAGDGRPRWQAAVPGRPGPWQPWNSGALTGLAAGRFTGGPHDDLIVFARRSTMHSDEGYLLAGGDGRLVWRRTTSFDGTTTWGFGGAPVVAVDADHDGAQDIVSLYPVNLTVVGGRDGRQRVGRSAAGDDIMPGIWAAYSTPCCFDFDGDRHEELVWAGPYGLAITDLAGNTRWCLDAKTELPGGVRAAYPVDWTGNGSFSLLVITSGHVLSIDPADGTRRWELELPGADQAVIGDLNGDGRDEAAILRGDQLTALAADQQKPHAVWTVKMPSAGNELILADTDGDGLLEVVVRSQRGRLWGIDQR